MHFCQTTRLITKFGTLTFTLLEQNKVQVSITLEHEKFWRKNLPELEVMLDSWQSFCAKKWGQLMVKNVCCWLWQHGWAAALGCRKQMIKQKQVKKWKI